MNTKFKCDPNALLKEVMSDGLRDAFARANDPKDQDILDCPVDSCVGCDSLALDMQAAALCQRLDSVVDETEYIWDAVRHQIRIYMFS